MCWPMAPFWVKERCTWLLNAGSSRFLGKTSQSAQHMPGTRFDTRSRYHKNNESLVVAHTSSLRWFSDRAARMREKWISSFITIRPLLRVLMKKKKKQKIIHKFIRKKTASFFIVHLYTVICGLCCLNYPNMLLKCELYVLKVFIEHKLSFLQYLIHLLNKYFHLQINNDHKKCDLDSGSRGVWAVEQLCSC